jgi:hypothetical protein
LNAALPLGRLGRWARVATACVLAGYATVLLVNSPFTLSLLSWSLDYVPLADFGSFYASAQAGGRGLDPFDVYPLTMGAHLGRGTGAAVNLNAPLSVLLFQPLTLFDPRAARLGWFVATMVAYAATVGLLAARYPLSRDPLRLSWPFALAGFWETVNLGQVYVFLALLSTLAWLMLRRTPIAAGALIGLIAAFKPNFLIWPIVLLLGGHRRVGLAGLAASAIFGLLPALVYGARIYAQWLSAIRLEQVNPQTANASIDGLLARVGAPQWLALAAGAATLIAVSVWAWRRGGSVWQTSGGALVGLLLGSPVAWVGYTVFLLPVFALTRQTLAIVVAAALLCIPRLALQSADTASWVGLTIGSSYSVAWLLLAYDLRHLSRRERPADTQ